MARRNKKNRMVIESLEQRILLAGDPQWLNNATSAYDSPVAALNMTGHYAYESETTQASLSNILTVEMNNANGSAGAASGWDLIRVNQLNITAKSSGSYTVNGNDTLTHNNNG